MALRSICDDVWAFETTVRVGMGCYLPARATVLRLSDGKLLVHSPLAIDDATAKAVAAIGDVGFVITPSCLHTMHLKEAVARWPRARVLGAPGVEKKVPGVRFDPLGRAGAVGGVAESGDDLLVRRIEGAPSFSEHVFFHPRTRTLLVTDLVFNIHACRGPFMPLVLRMVGAWRKTAQSRAWRFGTKDRTAAAQSVHDVLAWDFERVVMAHGTVLEDQARAVMRGALGWMAGAAPPLLGPQSQQAPSQNPSSQATLPVESPYPQPP